MSQFAVRVRGIGKQYHIGDLQHNGARFRYKAFRDVLAEAATWPWRALRSRFSGGNGDAPESDATFWALRDLSFDIYQGDILGVIGRNGAGKSTLLKILSRITEPTEGEAELYGRVGSLLEVGTGFHPELTGRDNIYLNGSILGMRKAEIRRAFDEIVAFAEIEKFLDTPVKRYSSGMFMRLAFSVAAHLNPEILLIDEVLAVGDAQFQDKCLGKMGEVARSGRTVFFVSHNMSAVRMLCTKAMLLENGRMTAFGDVEAVTTRYLSSIPSHHGREGGAQQYASADGSVCVRSVRVEDAQGRCLPVFSSSQPIYVVFELDIEKPTADLCIGFDLRSPNGGTLLRSYHNDLPREAWPPVQAGRNVLVCTLPAGLLNGGQYLLSLRISEHFKRWLIHTDDVVSFHVVLDHGESPFWAAIDHNSRPGAIAPIFEWRAH